MIAGRDLLAILSLFLVLCGANRISGLGVGLGKGIRNFKKGLATNEAIGRRSLTNSDEKE